MVTFKHLGSLLPLLLVLLHLADWLAPAAAAVCGDAAVAVGSAGAAEKGRKLWPTRALPWPLMPLPAAAALKVLLYCQLALLPLLLLLLLLATGLAVAGRLAPAAPADAPCFFAAAGVKPRLLCTFCQAADADSCCSSCDAGRLFVLAGVPAACLMSCMYLQEQGDVSNNTSTQGQSQLLRYQGSLLKGAHLQGILACRPSQPLAGCLSA